MTKLAEIQDAILALKPEEQQALRTWLGEIEETPEMLAALDEGVSSLERNGGKIQTRAELQEKVRRWAGGSH